MPRPKKQQSNLGKSLINKKKKQETSKLHVADLVEPSEKLKSVIDQSTLNEFLQEVELSSRNFEALKETKIKTEHHVIDMNSVMNLRPKTKFDEKNLVLRIPRRPAWNASTTHEQLNQMENESFLNWRRDLAKIEEELLIDRTMTPFEKNLEVWKQLWRVTEKSDIVVQIVDGRNPLFFRCPDLETYVKELDPLKENFILINKSDLLSENIRKCWNDYLNAKGINHIFFSAKKEQEKIDTDKIEEEEKEEEEEFTENTDKIFTRKNLLAALKQIVLRVKQSKLDQIQENPVDNKSSIKSTINPDLVTIGMVGYPNVGKSSVINVLCKKKLVGVAAQPGKTKHFQTLFIEKDLMLCDCPGLVFPNFTSNRSEMVCNGVLPIDKLRDFISPVQFMCLRIPKHVFEVIYKIKVDATNPTGSQILQAYSKQRGHFTGRALPDEGKAARIFLKDLVNGKLLFCELPPEYEKGKYGAIIQYNEGLNKAETTQQNITNPEEIEETKQQLPENNRKEGENEEQEESKAAIDDEEFFEDEPTEEDGMDPYAGLDNDDLLLLLLEGKSVKGIKLTKDQRRDIKFAVKRGEKIDVNSLLKTKKASTGVKSLGTFATDNFMKARMPYSSAPENNKN
jgi:large subunit GTPase 1